MKIKQTTKMIILVVALVSVIGIGAVSYAAWQGGATSITATAQTGSMQLIGFTGNAIDALSNKVFVPYDQGENAPEGSVTYVSFAVPEFISNGAWKINLKISNENVSFYVNHSNNAITSAPENLTNWTKITATGVEVLTGNASEADNGVVSDTGYINIVLDSSSFNDMNVTGIEFTLEVVANA